jgi:NAD(P)-dependent dehydrogenase (short-subunit alcohol dehydrogenase family)
MPDDILLDYASTKATIANFTKALAKLAIKQGVRVNAVAPGPVWTPLIPATMPAAQVKAFGSDTLFKRTSTTEGPSLRMVVSACRRRACRRATPAVRRRGVTRAWVFLCARSNEGRKVHTGAKKRSTLRKEGCPVASGEDCGGAFGAGGKAGS